MKNVYLKRSNFFLHGIVWWVILWKNKVTLFTTKYVYNRFSFSLCWGWIFGWVNQCRGFSSLVNQKSERNLWLYQGVFRLHLNKLLFNGWYVYVMTLRDIGWCLKTLDRLIYSTHFVELNKPFIWVKQTKHGANLYLLFLSKFFFWERERVIDAKKAPLSKSYVFSMKTVGF